MVDIQVRKRDRSLEKWRYDKLLTSISKAGIPLKKAKSIASRVEKWAQRSVEKGIISSSKVRGKVIDVLREAVSAAAKRYETYKK